MRRGADEAQRSGVPGLALRRDGAKTWWSLLSRGDRVHGFIIRPPQPAPYPVILLAGPDGCASSVFSERAASAWCARAALVGFDLPLCGSRHSDKLSALALDPQLPLAKRLRPELEAQVGADLTQVLALIRTQPELDSARVTFVAVGLGAELARAFLAEPGAVTGVALAPDAKPPESWYREISERASRA